jgi:hypothetical protein
MARKKSPRSQLYRAARDIGNVEAFERGVKKGGVLGGVEGEEKRYARRAVYRTTNKWTASFLRSIGLQGTKRKR